MGVLCNEFKEELLSVGLLVNGLTRLTFFFKLCLSSSIIFFKLLFHIMYSFTPVTPFSVHPVYTLVYLKQFRINLSVHYQIFRSFTVLPVRRIWDLLSTLLLSLLGPLRLYLSMTRSLPRLHQG